MEAALGARLDAEHQRRPLYQWEAASERRRLLEWWGITLGSEHTRADLAARLAAHPNEAVELLLPFRSHGFMMETGLPTSDVLSERDYQAVAKLGDTEVVLAALRRQYGDELGLDYNEYHPPHAMSPEELVAHQFAYQHRLAQRRAAESQ